MSHPTVKKLAAILGVILAAWLSVRYALPILLPFLLGATLAIAAEPSVGFLTKRLRLPRSAAAGIGVTATLVLLTGILVLLAGILVRQLRLLAEAVPDLEQTAKNGLTTLQDSLLRVAEDAPEGVRPLLSGAVTNLFSNSSAILDRISAQVPSVISGVLGHVPGGALAAGTGILSGFMISARLPRIIAWLKKRPVSPEVKKYAAALKQTRKALVGWLKAQLKLSGVSFLILCAGFLLLRVSAAPVWAFLVALVDAIPILGTGTVLIPWALVCLLRGESVRAMGLLGIYAVTFLSRTALEPRLVGKQLGLDPLMTLIALYAGYRFWGFAGMILSPMLCVAATELLRTNAP